MLIRPPVLAEGIATLDEIDRLIGASRFASRAAAEGVVVRATGLERLVAKRIAPGYARRSDEAWVGEPKYNDSVVPGG